jgi:hypothetical protein
LSALVRLYAAYTVLSTEKLEAMNARPTFPKRLVANIVNVDEALGAAGEKPLLQSDSYDGLSNRNLQGCVGVV